MIKSKNNLIIICLVILILVLFSEIIRLNQLIKKLSPTNIVKQTYIVGSSKETSRLPENPNWPIYNNEVYNFSFQFPSNWHQDCNNQNIILPYSDRGGGGFVGLNILFYKNPKKLSLKKFIQTELPSGAIIFHKDRGDQFIILTIDGQEAIIDRFTPGAGDGQTIYINDIKNQQVISLYCGYCDDNTVDSIIKSFRFSTF